MYYQAEMVMELRFGDVIKGFVFTEPQVDEPVPEPLLFSVAAEAHSELKSGAVPEGLRGSLTENGISLSDRAYLSVRQADVKWLITDGNTVYILEKDEEKLNIYPEPESDTKYSIGITVPRFSVVLTPCCSIENKTILLTPLVGLRNTLFRNPYLAEDPTRLNRPVPPQKAVSPYVWENKLSAEERQKRIGEGAIYAFDSLFVYEKHFLLPKYAVDTRDGKLETNCYMIDIANTYRMNYDKINRYTPVPANVKRLQLSAQTRQELRDKVAYYYGRVPDEDKVLLES